MFKIEINKFKVRAKIGVTDKERKKYQNLEVTISFTHKTKNNKNHDNISNIVSYSEVIVFTKNFIERSKYKTLEKLIIEYSKVLKKEFNLTNLKVKISKPQVAKYYGCENISVSK